MYINIYIHIHIYICHRDPFNREASPNKNLSQMWSYLGPSQIPQTRFGVFHMTFQFEHPGLPPKAKHKPNKLVKPYNNAKLKIHQLITNNSKTKTTTQI